MEITIDLEAVRRIDAQEYAQACADIAALGPLAAYRRSQERHDARLAAAPDASTLACKAGCSWCCWFTVDVRAVEAFRILEVVETTFSPDEQARVRSEIEANSAILQPLDEMQRMQRNIKCPFLSAGRCTIYADRPQTCRNYHATDAAGCQQSFEQPENLDIDPEFAPLMYQTGGAHVEAFSRALGDAGYDAVVYELSTALAAAWTQSDARQRFEEKRAPFAGLEGAEVPPEFSEVAEQEE